MKKVLMQVLLTGVMLAAAGACLAVDTQNLSREDIAQYKKLQSEYNRQQESISTLTEVLYSGGAVVLVLLVGGGAFLIYMMKQVSRKHEDHVHQQISNYHHTHHDGDLDHSYRDRHNTHHHPAHHEHHHDSQHHH